MLIKQPKLAKRRKSGFFRNANGKIPGFFAWRFILASLFVAYLFTGYNPFGILKNIKALSGTTEKAYFNPGKISQDKKPAGFAEGWWNLEMASGTPDLAETAKFLEFSDLNSAFLAGGDFSLLFSDFSLDSGQMFMKNGQAIIPDAGNEVPNDLESFSDDLEDSGIEEYDIPEEASGNAGFSESAEEETPLAENDGSAEAEILDSEDEKEIEVYDIGEMLIEPALEELGRAAGSRLAYAQADAVPYFDSLGEIKDAKLFLSLALEDLAGTDSHKAEEIEKSSPSDEAAAVYDDGVSATDGGFKEEEEGADIVPDEDIGKNQDPESSPSDEAAAVYDDGVSATDGGFKEEEEAADAIQEEIIEIDGSLETIESEIIEIEESVPVSLGSLIKDFYRKVAAQAEASAQDSPKIILWYTMDTGDNPVWHELDSFSASRISNSLKGGYFEYEAPFIRNWQDIGKLSVKVEARGGARAFTAYIDSVWLETAFEPGDGLEIIENSRDGDLEIISGGRLLSATEDEAEFVFRYNKKERGLIGGISQFFGLSSFWNKVSVDVRLLGPEGNHVDLPTTMIMEEDGRFTVKFSGLGEFLKPGRQTIEIRIEDGSEDVKKTIQSETDFSWGVLAVNFNKSVYGPDDDSAFIQAGVLDDLGRTICDAGLDMEITDPSGEITRLSTSDGSIVSNPECGRENVISKPDYWAYYVLYGPGMYTVNLTASTSNGLKTVTDSFSAVSGLAVSVERTGPTRIYPLADYDMKLSMVSSEDFKGRITEKVPSEFSISNFQFSDNIQYPISDIRISEGADGKEIIFDDFEMKAGEEYFFSYEFDAPDISPEFYLLGPLRLLSGGEEIFAEIRSWQIASDLYELVYATNGVNVGWTSAASAWDGTDDTRAYRVIPAKNVDDSGNYLKATVNDTSDLGGVINTVEIGVEGYREATDVTAYVSPVFNGSTYGTLYTLPALPTSDDDTVRYSAITGDAAGPGTGNWTWDDIMNLDVQFHGHNANNSRTRTLYVDQIVIRVDYTPNNAPTSTFLTLVQRPDTSGIVDISIQAGDADHDDLRARLEYESGSGCAFTQAYKATLDSNDANATSTQGDADIDNSAFYQIGTTTGWIVTAGGSNNVYFDWLSASDINNQEGAYCLRLTAFDGDDNQAVPATTTIQIDNKAPSAPGDLTAGTSTKDSIILVFGATSTDANFSEYKIFWKEYDGTAVTESDFSFTSADDPNLGEGGLNGAATTTVSGLSEDRTYSFAIWAYDTFGNKSSSSRIDAATNKSPYGNIDSAAQRADGSGIVDISISANDKEHHPSKARLEYDPGAECDFSSAQSATLDPTLSNISATYGVPLINNSWDYRIGGDGGYILTTATNTVQFDWISSSDLDGVDGEYCLRLTVNDGRDDQAVATTAVVTIDNKAPTAPAAMSFGEISSSTVKLIFNGSGEDTNFDRYEIHYREGTSGAVLSDPEHEDAILYFEDLSNGSTTVSGLDPNTDYVFNIWIFDQYGNVTPSTEATFRTDATITNNSLAFINPIMLNYAVAGTSTVWTFQAEVGEGGGYAFIDNVKLRLADGTDNEQPFSDLEFTWEQATDVFSETGDDAGEAVTLSPTSYSDCSGETCILYFDLVINHKFTNSSVNYQAELFSTNDSAVSDHDVYNDIYQVKLIMLQQLHYRWRNDDGGE